MGTRHTTIGDGAFSRSGSSGWDQVVSNALLIVKAISAAFVLAVFLRLIIFYSSFLPTKTREEHAWIFNNSFFEITVIIG